MLPVPVEPIDQVISENRIEAGGQATLRHEVLIVRCLLGDGGHLVTSGIRCL